MQALFAGMSLGLIFCISLFSVVKIVTQIVQDGFNHDLVTRRQLLLAEKSKEVAPQLKNVLWLSVGGREVASGDGSHVTTAVGIGGAQMWHHRASHSLPSWPSLSPLLSSLPPLPFLSIPPLGDGVCRCCSGIWGLVCTDCIPFQLVIFIF